jgi:hypothetical protein
MNFKNWLIIKDDNTRTFEVTSQTSNDNSFSNKIIAMQRDGMNVTSVILPVTNKNASKESIKFIGYTKEEGLHDRLLKKHNEIIHSKMGTWGDEG